MKKIEKKTRGKQIQAFILHHHSQISSPPHITSHPHSLGSQMKINSMADATLAMSAPIAPQSKRRTMVADTK
jgi:hypothetical protein